MRKESLQEEITLFYGKFYENSQNRLTLLENKDAPLINFLCILYIEIICGWVKFIS